MNKLFVFILFLLGIGFVNAQEMGNFYYRFNINQEYRNNILIHNDSSKINDFRFRSSILVGYNGNISILRGNWDISYENRYQQYFKFSDYTRREHLFIFRASIPIHKQNSFYFNEDFRIRNYKNLNHNNYLRNIFSISLKSTIVSKLELFVGYKNWIKNYPNIISPKNYLSHRTFMKLNYQFNRATYLGVKTEFQWHKGFLYPSQTNFNYIGNLSGSRYLIEILGNKIFFKNILVDLTYKFEYDLPSNLNNQSTGNNQGDEEPEDLLVEDPDYDYLKNQAAVSLLYRINAKISFFSFIVLQNKDFNSWLINKKRNTLRSDQFFYSSLILKYKFLPNFRINLYYNYEKRNSNLIKMNYHRNTIGAGLQYNF